MIFAEISPKDAAQYSYSCGRLKQTVNTMHTARKTLENVANTSFDKSFAKCVYQLTSESLQCENEIRSQIDSLNCISYEEETLDEKKLPVMYSIHGLDSICNYFEEVYIHSYFKLLKDRKIIHSVKSLIQNHVRLFMATLTQLRLFNEVKSAAN